MSHKFPMDKKDVLQLLTITSLPPHFYYIPNFITPEEEASILHKIPAQRWVTLSHRRLQAHPSTLTKNNTLLAAPLPPWLTKPVVERFKLLGIFDDTPHKEPNHVLINEYNRGEGIMPHEDGAAYAPVVATVSLGAPICLEITQKPNSLEQDGCSAIEELKDDEKEPTKDGGSTGGIGHGESINTHTSPTSRYQVPTRILQEPRSLLITTGPAYTDLLHGISPVEVDDNLSAETVANWTLLSDPSIYEEAGGRNERSTRISLTYRDVLRVSSAASKVLGGHARR